MPCVQANTKAIAGIFLCIFPIIESHVSKWYSTTKSPKYAQQNCKNARHTCKKPYNFPLRITLSQYCLACKDRLAHVCWLCGGNRLHCLGAFGQGISILLKVWQWGGMTLPAAFPFQRPPDFGLHGVHRLVHCAGSGLVKALMHHHGWTKGRALVWVQWFWDNIRVESRTATAADCEQEKVGNRLLRLERTAAGAWVKRQGWDCIAD